MMIVKAPCHGDLNVIIDIVWGVTVSIPLKEMLVEG